MVGNVITGEALEVVELGNGWSSVSGGNGKQKDVNEVED